MKTLLYTNRAEPKSISVISILLLAAVGDITKLRCMHMECYIFASQNLWYKCPSNILFIINEFINRWRKYPYVSSYILLSKIYLNAL